VSLVYYYTQAHIKTVLNIAVLFLIIFVIYMTILNNLVYPTSFLVNYINRQYKRNDILIKILINIYLLMGLAALIYIYVTLIASISLYTFSDETRIGRVFNSGARKFTGQSNFLKLVLVVIFFPAILYHFEQISNVWAMIIKRHKYHIKGQNVHFIPVMETLHQNKIFEYMNIADSRLAKNHASIFLKGVVCCILYALLVLPRLNMTQLCSGGRSMSESDREETESKAKEYAGKFRFGLLLAIIMTVFLHIGETLMQGAKTTVALAAQGFS